VLSKSSVSLRCLLLIAETLPAPLSSRSSGVSGGVARSVEETEGRLLRMSRGGVANGRPRSSPDGESGGGVGGYELESLKLSEPNEDSVERSDGEEDEKIGVRLSVTQSGDPLSGGHLALGMSKTPPGPARERGRVIVHGVVALDVADSKHARNHVGRESPISNGSTAVGGANTR